LSDAAAPVIVERVDDVSIVTINRAHRRNALDLDAFEHLERAFDGVSRSSTRAVVLTGAGPSFCAGLDLDASFGNRSGGTVEGTFRFMRLATACILAMREMPQPVVAAVRGHAVGGGFSLAAMADVRVLAPDARFHAGFIRLGMSPGDLGLSWILPRQIGAARATELFFSAGSIDADDAVRLGFASRVVEDPLGDAIAVAREIAAAPPFGVQQTKEMVNASLAMSGLREHLELELRTQVVCSLTTGHTEAVEAFLRGQRSGRAPSVAPSGAAAD
jgi:enoyl-CoA hydratase